MESPKLALIPSGYKSGKVYSILPTDGVGDFDFSRNAPATRVDSDGLIETVTNDVPRLDWLNSDCPSLLLEPQRTNDFTYSEEFNQSVWFKSNSTITTNEIISPNGTLTADLLTSNASGGGVFRFSGWSTTQKTISIFVKKNSSSTAEIFNASSGTNRVVFNLDNGTITTQGGSMTGQIENFGSGWFRISATHTGTGSQTFGLKPQTNLSLFIWGAQSESAAYPTTYIKTTSGLITRQKDFIDGAGSSSLFNSLESTFFVEMASFLNAQTNSNGIELADISGQNRITLQYDTINNQIRCDVRVLNSAQAIITTQSFDITNFNKMAITYKLNEVKFYVNGQLISTDTSVNTFAPNTLSEVRSTIADISSDAFNLQAKIKDLRVYDRVLTQAEAIELTTI